MLEHVQRLPIEVVHTFLIKRDAVACGIKEGLANYILQINDAYNLYKRYRGISDCAEQLRLKYTELSLPTCKNRVNDAIMFFNADCDVTTDAWYNTFADRMAKLFEVNLVARDMKEARMCLERELDWRIKASQHRVDPRRTQFKHILIDPNVKLERMIDTSPQGLLSAWEEIEDIISEREISQSEKNRLRKEAGRELDIDYTKFEEIKEDEDGED